MIWFRGHRGIWSKVGLDLRGFFPPLWFHDFTSEEFLCVCGIVPFGESFWRSAPAKGTLRLKAGVPPPDVISCDAEETPGTATTLPEPCQPPHPPVRRVFLHPMTWPAEGTQVYSQEKPLAFSAPLHLLELGWCTEMDPGRNTELCPLLQPLVASLGHHRDGRLQLHQHGSAEKLWTRWILPGSKVHFCCGWGWSVLSSPTPTPASGLLLAKWGPRWLLPKTPEQGHCHGKGLQTEPTQGCTAPHISFKCTELWGWPTSLRGITQYLCPGMLKLWEAARHRWHHSFVNWT